MTLVGVEMRQDRVVARLGELVLYEYVFRPHLDNVAAPRPFWHPMRTVRGTSVSEYQPSDHPWHLGLAYSWPIVNEWNIWGGPTYLRGSGYVELDNRGRIEHEDWVGDEERLVWRQPDGTVIATETRKMATPVVDEGKNLWTLTLETEIENRLPTSLRLGSPTTEGRPMAGYAGLSWRGAPAFVGGTVLIDQGVPEDPMGCRSDWLAVVGSDVTVALVEDPGNPRFPTRWFVRTEPYALVTSSPVFDEALELAPGDGLLLRHRLIVVDGAEDFATIANLVA